MQGSSEEIRELIIAYQEMVGAEMDIALMMAGLPGAVAATLNDHVLTFFNRAMKVTLPPLKTNEIELYYTKAFKESGVNIADKQIQTAAEKTEGSPYLMQLIGHYITLVAEPGISVTGEQFEQALRYAEEDFLQDICGTSLRALSEKDIAFLAAMAEDEKDSRLSDIGERLEVSSAYAQTYKRRLLQAGIIEQFRRGSVRFAIPYMKEYLARL